MDKIQLQGFNNLTKTLSFSIYEVCYVTPNCFNSHYRDYIDKAYSAERLAEVLKQVTKIIGANVLNVARADYEPQGASVTMLLSEDAPGMIGVTNEASPGPAQEAFVAHLDKSHLTIHTYPDHAPASNICTFRADIEVSTCGMISPLKALNYLIGSFRSNIVTIDYRVRGFTRDNQGCKIYIDHEIDSIQNFIPDEIKQRYQLIDFNILQSHSFHTKMMRQDLAVNDFLFQYPGEIAKDALPAITRDIQSEMEAIFYHRH